MIGDVLASTVICELIKNNYPNAEVHYIIQKNTFAVVENNPFIDKVILFESNKHKGLLKLYRFGKELKKENYDVVIDAYGKWDSILPAYFSNARTRVGQYKFYTHFFYTQNVYSDSEPHDSANAYRHMLFKTAFKIETEIIYPKIHLTKQEIHIAKKEIHQNLDDSKPIFMISILGSSINKSLPPKNMAETLDVVANTKDVQLVFNYIPNQFEDVKAIYDLCLPATQAKINISFYAKSLRSFIAILSQCDCLIGNEGGATNISKALSIPTFTIFSPCIRRKSWDSREDDINYFYVHLIDYYPEIYKDKHPKILRKKIAELYALLLVKLYKDKLLKFIDNLKSKPN